MLNEEVDDMSDVVVKKDNLLERLNKRNKDRQNFLDVKLEQRNKENLGLEGEEYFSQTFAERAHEIEIKINNAIEVATKKTGGDAPPTAELGHLFSGIILDIQELQRYLTTSTMFLTDFKIKACQNVLNDLSGSCESARVRLVPKKKFGFSGKKVAPKVILNPKVNLTTDTVDAQEKPDSSDTNKTIFTWTLSNRKNEILCLRDNEVNGQDITISDLQNCLVELQGYAGSVQISNAKNCTFLCGPISRSLFAENCQNCTLAVACQQLRLHSSSNIQIHLHVTCRAIIEDCKDIGIAKYVYDYPAIEHDFEKAGLDKELNNYKDIADFNWLSPDVPSPNWRLLDECPKPNWAEFRITFKEKLLNNENL